MPTTCYVDPKAALNSCGGLNSFEKWYNVCKDDWKRNLSLTLTSYLSCRGANLFSAFLAVLKSHDSSDGTRESLLAEFKALDEHFELNVRVDARVM